MSAVTRNWTPDELTHGGVLNCHFTISDADALNKSIELPAFTTDAPGNFEFKVSLRNQKDQLHFEVLITEDIPCAINVLGWIYAPKHAKSKQYCDDLIVYRETKGDDDLFFSAKKWSPATFKDTFKKDGVMEVHLKILIGDFNSLCPYRRRAVDAVQTMKSLMTEPFNGIKIVAGPELNDIVDANRTVLCNQSPYFRGLFKGPWIDKDETTIDVSKHSLSPAVWRHWIAALHCDYSQLDDLSVEEQIELLSKGLEEERSSLIRLLSKSISTKIEVGHFNTLAELVGWPNDRKPECKTLFEALDTFALAHYRELIPRTLKRPEPDVQNNAPVPKRLRSEY